jgi:alpha-beta hydrolase superfamily lysophospholipase
MRSEGFDEYQLPEGVSAFRILYHSRSADGEDVAASGVVLLPDEPPPAGGWPVIAWAHSFTGTARRCAPSLMRNLNEGPFLSMYVKLGYAVVATDYVGLGTNFRNASVDMQSNAADVIYSIAASRAAVPQLGRKWVAMGESAGGLAALGVAELERDIRDPNYLGSIAVSGIADGKELYEEIAKDSPGQFVFLAYGVQTLYPRFQVNQVHFQTTPGASIGPESGLPVLVQIVVQVAPAVNPCDSHRTPEKIQKMSTSNSLNPRWLCGTWKGSCGIDFALSC